MSILMEMTAKIRVNVCRELCLNVKMILTDDLFMIFSVYMTILIEINWG